MKPSIFTLACALVGAISIAVLYRQGIETIAKQRDGYELLVREMQQADDYDTCSDYPQWQEGAYVVEGTVFCINGQEVRTPATGFAGQVPGVYK
jgi:hypothetical protein